MNLLGGLNPTLVAVHIAQVTNAVPARRRRHRGNSGIWAAAIVAVALVIIGVVR